MSKVSFSVICIDGVKAGLEGSAMDVTGYYFMTTAAPEEEIYEGKDYTVVETEDHLGATYYRLAERSEEILYHCDRFVILPDPSEEVGIEQEQEAIIYQR